MSVLNHASHNYRPQASLSVDAFENLSSKSVPALGERPVMKDDPWLKWRCDRKQHSSEPDSNQGVVQRALYFLPDEGG
jgi:hypothetical protein